MQRAQSDRSNEHSTNLPYHPQFPTERSTQRHAFQRELSYSAWCRSCMELDHSLPETSQTVTLHAEFVVLCSTQFIGSHRSQALCFQKTAQGLACIEFFHMNGFRGRTTKMFPVWFEKRFSLGLGHRFLPLRLRGLTSRTFLLCRHRT